MSDADYIKPEERYDSTDSKAPWFWSERARRSHAVADDIARDCALALNHLLLAARSGNPESAYRDADETLERYYRVIEG